MKPRPSRAAGRAFGNAGGWHLETRTSRAAKARERAWLWYAGRQGTRERLAKLLEPTPCEGGCGALITFDPHQRGPKRKWCTSRCYFRVYMRNLRAARKRALAEGTEKP